MRGFQKNSRASAHACKCCKLRKSKSLVKFELYTTRTVRQCMSALTDRLEAKPTKTRPALDGTIEKGGKFKISVRQPVANNFHRTTRLRGIAKRENGVTVIRGYVPNGVARNRIGVIIGSTALVGVFFMINGSLVPGIIATVLGAALYVPLVGDYNNREILLKELQKATKAKQTPPQ